MKVLIAALILLSICVFAEDNFLKNKTIMACENEEGYPPFIFSNPVSGKMEGYSVDLLNLVFKNSGAEIKYKLLPWVRCMKEMSGGKTMDIVLAAASTKERRDKYIFSDAFAEVHLAYFYNGRRHPKDLNIETPSDLDNLGIICGMRGFVYGSYGLPKKVVQMGKTFQQLAKMVARGRCDAFLVRYEVFKSLPMAYPDFKYHGLMKGGIIPWRKDSPIKFYFLAKKNSLYHRKLINFINKRINLLKKSGQLQEIKKKYNFKINN